MTFLQPLLLAGLPLVALPLIIHLINQRRFQTLRWGAMMFLLAANRMSRGFAKLRQWLIMLFRMLAIAALIFAVSRPLASGWLGLAAGGRADTTLILLDRSPSMQQRGSGSAASKLETGRQQLVQTLKLLGSSRWVLIESTTNQPRDLESPEALLSLTETEPTSAAADLPSMLQAAHDYIQANKSGHTEVWICSDLRANDWNAESGRWQALRDSFLEFAQGVRFHLLAYSQPAPENLGIRVTEVRRLETSDAAELLVSLKVKREAGDGQNDDVKTIVPIEFLIEGSRSVMNVEFSGREYELKDHRIPIERARKRGWGKVSIPADENPADNDFYFAFSEPAPRHTLIVADDPLAVRPLQLAAAISPNPAVKNLVEIVTPDQVSSVEWEKVGLVLWHSQLPEAEAAKLVESFVGRGGQMLFLPPRDPGSQELFGIRWKQWIESPKELAVDTWRGDQDLLAHTLSGAALPVGQLEVQKYCEIQGELTPLATLGGGVPLMGRVTTNRGGVYFCATTPALADSSLASNGVVLYIVVQRALAAGAEALGNTRQLVAGPAASENSVNWKVEASSDPGYSTEYPFHRGVYSTDDKLLVVNRDAAEDQAPVLGEGRVAELFKGLDFARVDDSAGNLNSLIQEIWRLFLTMMMVAMVVEAGLCLPKVNRVTGAST
ncbi:MAG: N-terminal double-transrane protein [Planctomycetaceae bacterium]|nr:N-terminal double-transrane protein [Planctomycetaceae bacterium]